MLLGLYQSGQLKLDELVTKRYQLEDINQGYRDMHDGKVIRALSSMSISSSAHGADQSGPTQATGPRPPAPCGWARRTAPGRE